ncbi:MAG: S-methyl-5'-thioinosine phosphorylase [candidate division WS1 bacterium]|jgi:5'-methylthioadenosine phosphorylase|nr:S-methyl-5'-thioinosine phosphorylase [candidate division WS1 bacterium]
MRIGLIAGSGIEDLFDEQEPEEIAVQTQYGEVPVWLVVNGDREVAFLPRHGKTHGIPPHRINYRANIRAFEALGCHCVIATNAVGSMNRHMEPGDFVVVDQFLDFTKQRPLTFFDGDDGVVRHVDVTEPYCPRLREVLREACRTALGEELHVAGSYLCVEGPRFETPAEIEMYARLGGDVIGMTGLPEAVLAREAGLCYATLCVVSNWAAGITDAPISHEEVNELMDQRQSDLFCLLREAIARAQDDDACACRRPFG